MPILPEISSKIQEEILPLVRKKWRPMMTLGINALSTTPFMSLNANARISSDKPEAAMKQMWRLSQHEGIRDTFPKLLKKMVKITNESVISIDFTIMHPFAVLCFALQTKNGRAVPVWVDVIKYPIEDKTSQNLLILSSLKEFLSSVGCQPRIVCDRGFIGQTLIQGFLDLGVLFYVRLKSGMHWRVDGKRRQLRKQWSLDQVGTIYSSKLRVVRSSRTLQKKLKAKETWFILTNDTAHSRSKILSHYYHRFEIEETFKDIKHILNTKPRWFKKVRTLKILLWFQVLGIQLFAQINQLPGLTKQIFVNQHKKMSWIRLCFEQLTREKQRLLVPIYHHGSPAM